MEDEIHRQITTIERFILEQQLIRPEATGVLTNLLYDLALAGKIIASRTTRAGLVDILGSAGEENVQGEEVQKLDKFADRTLCRLNDHTGRLAVMASEEHADIISIPERFPVGKYVLLFDPLDGSSNIDFNVSVGTVFSIYHRKTREGRGTLEDCLQKGRDLVAAGYFVYGSSTMLVYSTGHGVHGFTLDPSLGEFLLSHPNICIPDKPSYYSVNQGYQRYWSPGVRRFTEWLQGQDGSRNTLPLRYIGSLMADVHRTLLSGGSFITPPIPRTRACRAGSYVCSTKPSPWPSWPNRRAATPQTDVSLSSIFNPRVSTSERLSSSAAVTWCKRRKNSSAHTTDTLGEKDYLHGRWRMLDWGHT
jgi:fructose-1,6-bisphosphatase I